MTKPAHASGDEPFPTVSLRGLRLWVLSLTFAIILLLIYLIGERQAEYFSGIFRVLLYYDLWYAIAFLLALALAGMAASRAERLPSLIGRHPWSCAALVLAATTILAPLVYRLYPLSMDEFAVHFQSQTFAAGQLSAFLPVEWLSRLVPPYFHGWFLVISPQTGETISIFWPGFAFVMTPFSALGAGWLCNPVITALTVPAVMYTAARIYPEQPDAAGWAAAFTIASPVFVVMGLSSYAMPGLMLLNILFVMGFLQARPLTLFCSGIAGSLALTFHNPLPHMLFAAPWILWLVWTQGLGRKLIALALGYLPLTLIFGIGWIVLRAQVMEMPEQPAEETGIAGIVDRSLGIFVLPDLTVLHMRAAGLVKLWIWSMPGLLVFAVIGAWMKGRNPHILLLAASGILTFAGYFIVPFDQGHGWGYRYFHSAWFVLPLLAIGFVVGAQAPLSRKAWASALAAASVIIMLPVFLAGTGKFVWSIIDQVPPASSASPLRLTFVYPDRGFAAELVQNDPFLDGDDLFLFGSNAEDDARLARALSPEARIVAQTNVGVMWQLPVPEGGLRALLDRTPPPEGDDPQAALRN